MFGSKSCSHQYDTTRIVPGFLWGWMACFGLWTVALAGRLAMGVVLWVRFLWIAGLTLALGLLIVLFAISLVYGIRSLRYRHRVFHPQLMSPEKDGLPYAKAESGPK